MIRAMMAVENIPSAVIDAFCRNYHDYCSGVTGYLSWSAITPLENGDCIDEADILTSAEYLERGEKVADQVVSIRLNGGLGTTMGLDCPKSTIPLRDNVSFLEIIAEQIKVFRQRHHVRLPLLLMNSVRTRPESLALLASCGLNNEDPSGGGAQDRSALPLDFLQYQVPRIDAETKVPLTKASFSTSSRKPSLWAPAGHGDIYLSLWLSGLLARLVSEGYRWAFIANADNLGATLALPFLGYLDAKNIDFGMELTTKTLADRKGGTLIRHHGRLALLERAQVAPEHLSEFEDIQKFSLFNTNTLWVRLDALLTRLEAKPLTLPLIVNPKSFAGRSWVQLETAMGAAIASFSRTCGLKVDRRRFAPVKATSDLLALRSDAYGFDDNGALCLAPARNPRWGPPLISLDPLYYAALRDFDKRFLSPPSLVGCRRLKIEGDIAFGRNIRIEGDVSLVNRCAKQIQIPDNTQLSTSVVNF